MTPGRALARALAMIVAAAVLLTACGSGETEPSADADAVQVVATTTMLADLVAQVGGTHVAVSSLVPRGGEVHTFDPTPSDVRRLADADLVVRNGLGLDDWLADLVADAGTGAPMVALGEDLPGVTYLAGEEPGEAVNPHLWLDVEYASLYADRIADALAAADPAHATDYEANVAAYAAELAALDAELVATIGEIPAADRTVISFHDAFPYFAAAYGLTIDGTIVGAPGQDPSAGDLADLVRVVEERGVKAILAEAQFNDELARTIADETGATVVSSLLTDSLGDAPHDTYVGAMRWNVEQVAAALAGG